MTTPAETLFRTAAYVNALKGIVLVSRLKPCPAPRLAMGLPSSITAGPDTSGHR